jgi:predicted ATPase/DNA-binding SARP family transcriptional activator
MIETQAQLLGIPKVNLNGVSVSFSDDKRFRLLAFLACRNDWVAREQLSDLFWSDTDSVSARKNLRHLIARTKALTWLTGFEIQLEHLRFVVSSDLTAFKTAFEQSEWHVCLELYRGVLLEGLSADDSREFSNWLETERENIQNKWRTAALNQARILKTQHNLNVALRILEQLLQHDPLDEEVMNDFMQLCAEMGQTSSALRTYDNFSKRLSAELSLPPPLNLERLAGRIRANSLSGGAESRVATIAQPKPKQRLPVNLTPFIGRELLLAELTNALEQREFRLLTLVGQGGVGKTRIALQIAQEQQTNISVGFVNLVPLDSPSLIPSLIAETIGLNLQGKAAALTQVIEHIATKRMLLVIDNFEHLIAGAPYLKELIERCENLVLLVTSREALGLQSEQITRVEAFHVPEVSEVKTSEISSLEAVQLFAGHAKRVRPDFLIQENTSEVLEICRLVEGLPLGIELAAVWVRALPIAEIAAEIAHNLDFLTSRQSDLSVRHRSIRAAFEHSWNLLTLEEQQALRCLSVFRGGFTREAVKQVLRAPPAVLGSLIDKSLLSLDTFGRYRRHRLLHQYASEKLLEYPQEDLVTRNNHAQYFFSLLQNELIAIRSGNSGAALERLQIEFENIRVAWRYALGTHKTYFLKSGAEALMRFFDARGRYQEAISMFQEAITSLSENQDQAVLGTLLIHQSKFYMRRAQHEIAEQLGKKGLALLEPLEEIETMIWGLGGLGSIATIKGNHHESLRYRQQALVKSRALNNERLIAVSLGWIAICEADLGDHNAAKQHFREAIHLFKKLGNQIGALFNLINLAGVLIEQGEFEGAMKLLHEALELSKSAGEISQTLSVLNALGDCAYQMGDFDQARHYIEQALEFEQDQSCEKPSDQVDLQITLAKINLVQGQPTQAKKHLSDALGKVWETQELPFVMKIFLYWAEFLSPNLEFGNQLLWVVQQHPTTRGADRYHAKTLLRTRDTVLSTKAPELESLIQQIRFGYWINQDIST